jgi:hypothetical protein
LFAGSEPGSAGFQDFEIDAVHDKNSVEKSIRLVRAKVMQDKKKR